MISNSFPWSCNKYYTACWAWHIWKLNWKYYLVVWFHDVSLLSTSGGEGNNLLSCLFCGKLTLYFPGSDTVRKFIISFCCLVLLFVVILLVVVLVVMMQFLWQIYVTYKEMKMKSRLPLTAVWHYSSNCLRQSHMGGITVPHSFWHKHVHDKVHAGKAIHAKRHSLLSLETKNKKQNKTNVLTKSAIWCEE